MEVDGSMMEVDGSTMEVQGSTREVRTKYEVPKSRFFPLVIDTVIKRSSTQFECILMMEIMKTKVLIQPDMDIIILITRVTKIA